MGYNDRHESGGGSNAVLVVAIVLALLLGVPLVLGVVLVLVGGLMFVSIRSDFESQGPIPTVVDSEGTQAVPDETAPLARQPSEVPGLEPAPLALNITIDAAGRIQVDTIVVSNDDELRRLLDERFGDRAEEVSATVRAHRNTQHAVVVRVVGIMQEAGVESVNIRVAHESGAGPESVELLDDSARSSSEP
jgi:biopolymer transport protein ExbD